MENEKVIRSAGLIGGFTLLSRGLGLIRDVSMAAFFGTSLYMSAFVVGFTIPNLFRRLFGEGALSAAFVPVFVESRVQEGDNKAWVLANKIISLATTVLILLVLLGLVLVTLGLWFPLGESAEMILSLLRIMLPYMLFICLAALSMGILNSFHHFAVPAATPCLLNLIWIATVWLVCPRLGPSMGVRIHAVAWGVLLAGVFQLAIQLPVLVRHGYRPGWSLDRGDERVARVLKLMGPAALGLAVTQVNVVMDRLLAIVVGPYAPAALFYSERLIYFPLGIFATALSTVLLPVFSGHAARNEENAFTSTINHSLRNLFFLMVPAAVGLWILAGPVIRMCFQFREFDEQSVAFTRSALQFYAPGLLVFSLAKIFVPAFYARQDTRTPVRIGVCTVGLNLFLNILFIITWPQPLKHAGLACATVISEGVYGIVLAVILHRKVGSPGWRNILVSMLRCLAVSVLMAFVAVYAERYLYSVCVEAGLYWKAARAVSVLSSIGLSVLFYGALTALLRCPELKEINSALRKKRRTPDE